jgi:hypothetical protein
MNMPGSSARFAAALLTFALAGCHHQDATQASNSDDAGMEGTDTALPKPASSGGPVTGMPSKPGPGPVGPPQGEGEDAMLATNATTDANSEATVTLPDAADATAATAATTVANANVPASSEPSVEDAVAVVRGYYAALAAHDATRAHAYWVQGTRPAIAPANDADTVSLSADVGAPGGMDAAAGSRYLRVPVTVTRTLRDGSTARTGSIVTLRRSVVDGATPEQRAWRIAFVDVATAPAQ